MKPWVRDARLAETVRISLEGAYVYKNAPKCGCSMIKRALWWAEHDAGRGKGDRDLALQGLYVHKVSDESPFTNDIALLAEQLIFTFVRNPYRRIYSAYIDKCLFVPSRFPHLVLEPLRAIGVGQRDVSFADFLAMVREQSDLERDTHWRSIYNVTAEDLLPAQFIGAIETCRDDLDELFRRIYPGKSAEIVNVNSRADIVKGAPPTAADYALIADLYAQDFAFYGYSDDPERQNEPPRRRGWRG